MSDAAENTEGADVSTDETDVAPSVEERAQLMGWRPQAEFKGDKDRWIDAETFVKRGEEILPILKANNASMERALADERKERAKLEKTLKDFADHHGKTEARAYDKALKEIQSQIAAAASVGDVQGVLDATEELTELRAEAKAKPAAEAPGSPEFDAWREDNDWYGKDKALSGAFDALCAEVIAEGYTTPKVGLSEAMKRLKAEFPAKFENPARRQAATVEGAGAPPRTKGKGYADLPPDAKAMCDDFVKRVPGFSREKYCKDFFA